MYAGLEKKSTATSFGTWMLWDICKGGGRATPHQAWIVQFEIYMRGQKKTRGHVACSLRFGETKQIRAIANHVSRLCAEAGRRIIQMLATWTGWVHIWEPRSSECLRWKIGHKSSTAWRGAVVSLRDGTYPQSSPVCLALLYRDCTGRKRRSGLYSWYKRGNKRTEHDQQPYLFQIISIFWVTQAENPSKCRLGTWVLFLGEEKKRTQKSIYAARSRQ